MKTVYVLPLVLALVLVGCVPSLHPLYTEEDLVFDPALVGVWSGEGSTETWAFTKSGEKVYRLVYTDREGKTGPFDAHLLSVDGRLYLDLFPADLEIPENDFYKGHLLPVHTFMRVKEIGSSLRMAPLSPEWVDQYLKDHPDAVRHEMVDDRLVLTAGPKELQAFLAAHEESEGVFGEFSDLVRAKEEGGEEKTQN